eukprot:CAMPEP_0201723698 /NCGR_PEP_ID=MMETSP0593-20130828/7650_1 /ASSEMBLY_ACC=CAM_ASM_000672 /TAXON_ID=267983 /ORGANISM="Skeletonema japonicum, Strain CCMP2506" /LENGTH=173 /DNA_ID=CAMNT_0048214829 /DNA_START=114 /DNA_END=635 /DNA_ORIENTATION=-
MPTSALEFAIYNEGRPSCTFYGNQSEHDVLQCINEEAIETCFPPSAEDAAELDAAEDFVETMAWLSFLDECDERARFSFEGLGKRWSARRAAGLIGKPNPMREGVVVSRPRAGTFTTGGSSISETDLVSYTPRKFEEKPRRFGKMHGGQQYGHVPRNVKTSHSFNIQQPRKQN